MDEIRQKINQLLQQFQKEELGNRLSQFSMMSLIFTVNQIFEEEKQKPINNKKTEIGG